MMLAHLFSLDYQRQRLASKLPDGPLQEFLSVPFPSPKSDARRVDYVALDLETTGLDAQKDEIVSVGLVCLTGTRIDLSTAQHRLVLPTRRIPEQSAVLHKITDDKAATGEPLGKVLTDLLAVLAGKVLIAHYARVETQFLTAACTNVFGGRFIMPVVDTLRIARRWLEQRGRVYSSKELRLAAIRERYNLPRYRAHDALSDALAAAELFTAQLAQRNSGSPLPLKEFLVKQ